MPLLALAVSPVEATVTFLKAGAYPQTRVGIRAPDTVTDGPSDQSSDFDADPYVVSRSDSVDERFQAQVRASSAGAGSFERPARAEFFVRSSVDAAALARDMGDDAGRLRLYWRGHASVFTSESTRAKFGADIWWWQPLQSARFDARGYRPHTKASV